MVLCNPMDYTIHGILQARILEWVAIPSCRGSLQADSLPAEPPGKPKTGVGSLSLPQGIFLTQEWNRDLLHCGWILYQLSFFTRKPIQWLRVSLTVKFICIQYLFHSIRFYQMLLPTPPPTSKNGRQSIQGGFLDGEENAPFPVYHVKCETSFDFSQRYP